MVSYLFTKKSLIVVEILFFAIAGTVIVSHDTSYEPTPTNYIGLVKLGLAPSADSRQPQSNDIDTGIKLRDGDKVYSLVESRTWQTNDYGKTFLIRTA